MRLVFKRLEDATIDTLMEIDGTISSFKYEQLILSMYNGELIDEPSFPPDIQQLERDKILELIAQLQAIVTEETLRRELTPVTEVGQDTDLMNSQL